MKEEHIFRNVTVLDAKTRSQVAIDIDMTIDLRAIACELAFKAYNNKKRRSSALGGLVEVKMRGTLVTPVEKERA